MNRLFTVKSEFNFAKLLKKYNSQIVTVFIFASECKESKKYMPIFVNYAKQAKSNIFVLLNITTYQSSSIFASKLKSNAPVILYYIHEKLSANHKCSDDIVNDINDNLFNIKPDKNDINIVTDGESISEKIDKIIELGDILNKMCMDEIQKLSYMKEVNKKLCGQ